MKSEERHRLEQNVLADWLGQWIVRIKPYLVTLLIAAVALAAVAGLTMWWMTNSARGSAEAWDRLYAALEEGNASKLEAMNEDFKGTNVGQWGAVLGADLRLNNGSRLLADKKPEAFGELDRAVKGYTSVLERARDGEIRARAYFGRAGAYEALAGTPGRQTDRDNALADYEKLLETDPDGAFAKTAQERIALLKAPATAEFLARFVDYKPQPTPSVTGGAKVGVKPSTEIGEGPAAKTEPAKPEAKVEVPFTPLKVEVKPEAKPETKPAAK